MSKDTIAGADIEIAKAIGDELGVKVKFSEMSFDKCPSQCSIW